MTSNSLSEISDLFCIQANLLSQYAEFDDGEDVLKSCTITFSSKEEIENEFYLNNIKIMNILSDLNFNDLYSNNINEGIIYMVGNCSFMITIYNLRKENVFRDGINQIMEQMEILNKEAIKSNYIDFNKALEIWIERSNMRFAAYAARATNGSP